MPRRSHVRCLAHPCGWRKCAEKKKCRCSPSRSRSCSRSRSRSPPCRPKQAPKTPCKPKAATVFKASLTAESIDFGVEGGQTAKARFSLGDCALCACPTQTVSVTWSATGANGSGLWTTSTTVTLTLLAGCRFEFDIPNGTMELRVDVLVRADDDTTVCVSGFYDTTEQSGAPCVIPMLRDLTGADLTLQLAILNANRFAIDTIGLDHVAPAPGDTREQHQLGPARSSRSVAMVQIAAWDAAVSIVGGFEKYTAALPNAAQPASVEAAIAQATYDTLKALYPSQDVPRLTDYLQRELAKVANGAAKTNGVAAGHAAAAAIVAARANDGSDYGEPPLSSDLNDSQQMAPYTKYYVDPAAGYWGDDPIAQHGLALGANWPLVAPFAIPSAEHYRAAPPPPLDSVEYTAAYEEAKALGGDGVNTFTSRSDELLFVGNYWAYDGTPSLCAPPRLYNQIAVQLVREQRFSPIQSLRALALVNMAMADAGLASWDSKYHYKLWRPVTAIRRADEDGNAATVPDPAFHPIGAPASNTVNGVNFTPPFPTYPSGHATFGGALFQTLRLLFGRDDIAFTFVSDEYNGVTADEAGNVRPLRPRSFVSLSQAEEENGQSRIYLGIHWYFDKTSGVTMGRGVADYVYANYFRPTIA